jgi:hypothetical protein
LTEILTVPPLRGWLYLRPPMRIATLALLLAVSPLATAWAAESVPIIFDTDMDSDCDDAGALAQLHTLADLGEAKILATTISSKHKWSAACVDAINTYHGRPNLTIGVPKASGPKEQGSRFARQISEEFPHDTPALEKVPDAVAVYRQVLAGQPDESVTVVTVGDLTNLRHLLESRADEHSPLEGRALVQKKVKHWVCMGSRYPADLDPSAWGNFKMDPEATVKAVAGWPTLVTFTGGGKFAELLASGKRLGETPKDNPSRRVYELYFGGEAKNRHSADQIAVLVGIRSTGKPWKLVTQGHNHIFPDGRHEWRDEPDNRLHQYISAMADGVDSREVARELEELMITPPKFKAE